MVWKGAGKNGRAEKLWRVGKSEEVDFEAEKKLIPRERDALQGWEGVELMPVMEWCVSGANDLRFIGGEFHKRGEELRNDRSANLNLVKTGGRERHRLSEKRVLLEGLIFISL